MYRFTSKQYTDKVYRYRLQARVNAEVNTRHRVSMSCLFTSAFTLACLVRVRAHKQARVNASVNNSDTQVAR